MPGAADPWGGCWPGPGNTGVPAGTVLTNYTGPCTITIAGTVIDSKTVTCSSLLIQTTGVLIKNSLLQDVDLDNGDIPNSSYVIVDSTITNGAREQCGCIAGHDFAALRVDDIGGNRGMYCINNCSIKDSWSHGRQLTGAQHGSGIREEQNTTITHSAFACDYPIVDDSTGLGCSADLTGYPDFAPINHNTVTFNLLIASQTDSFCMYGGGSSGKPFSSDPANATFQVFTDNVFQRGANGKCGDFGPVTDFITGRTGNVWARNVWDDGTAVNAA